MKKNKKAITMVTALALVGAVGIGSTLAYLSDQSNDLVNSFTVGNGYIEHPTLNESVWIDETKVGELKDSEIVNKYQDGDNEVIRTLEGNTYENILPGSILTKDPMVNLYDGSVKSHIVVKVTGLDAANLLQVTTTIDSANWVKIKDLGTDSDSGLDGYYLYIGSNYILDATGKTAVTPALFETLNVSENFKVDTADGQKTTIDNIELNALAIQAVKNDQGEEKYIADGYVDPQNENGVLDQDEVTKFVLDQMPSEFTASQA